MESEWVGDLAGLIEALQRQHKTEEDLATIQDAFRVVPFFASSQENMSPTTYDLLLGSLQYEATRSNTWLFHQGEKGEKLYVLIKGTVAVMQKRPPLMSPQGSPILGAQPSKLLLKYVHRLLYHIPQPKDKLAPINLALGGMVKSHTTIPLVQERESEKQQHARRLGEFKAMDLPKAKLNRGKAMLAYWMAKAWTTPGDSTFARFNNKGYFHNLMMSGLPPLAAEPSSNGPTATNPTVLEMLYPTLTRVNVLEAPCTFGDLAMGTDNRLRTASVLCLTPCKFAVLTVKGNTLGWIGIDKQRDRDKAEIAALFEAFSPWLRKNRILEVLPYMQPGKTSRGSLLYARGHPQITLILLSFGEVEVTLSRVDQPDEPLNTLLKHHRTEDSRKYRRLLKAPYLLGVEEILLGLDKRYFEARAVSTRVHYYEIRNDDIKEHLARRNKYFYDQIKEYSCLHNEGLPAGQGVRESDISFLRSIIPTDPSQPTLQHRMDYLPLASEIRKSPVYPPVPNHLTKTGYMKAVEGAERPPAHRPIRGVTLADMDGYNSHYGGLPRPMPALKHLSERSVLSSPPVDSLDLFRFTTQFRLYALSLEAKGLTAEDRMTMASEYLKREEKRRDRGERDGRRDRECRAVKKKNATGKSNNTEGNIDKTNVKPDRIDGVEKKESMEKTEKSEKLILSKSKPSPMTARLFRITTSLSSASLSAQKSQYTVPTQSTPRSHRPLPISYRPHPHATPEPRFYDSLPHPSPPSLSLSIIPLI